MYTKNKKKASRLKSVEITKDAVTLEAKIEKIVNNNEPIEAEAPEIFTERKEGVGAAYNIRTDRWELAAEKLDVVSKNQLAKREAMGMIKEGKEVDLQTGKEIIRDNDNTKAGEGDA